MTGAAIDSGPHGVPDCVRHVDPVYGEARYPVGDGPIVIEVGGPKCREQRFSLRPRVAAGARRYRRCVPRVDRVDSLCTGVGGKREYISHLVVDELRTGINQTTARGRAAPLPCRRPRRGPPERRPGEERVEQVRRAGPDAALAARERRRGREQPRGRARPAARA